MMAGMWSGGVVGQTTYVVDPINGNDGLPNGPWASIVGVNTHQGQFGPGDEILFTRGHTYRGELSFFDVDGALGAPITIGATGAGPAPVICGSDPIADNDWLSDPAPGAPGRHSAGLTDAPLYVFDGGALMTAARYPDSGWLRTAPGTTVLQIVSPGITQPDGYWNNARAVVRSANWNYNLPTVDGHTGNTLQMDPLVNMDFLDNYTYDWGFFMTGKEEEITMGTEWFFRSGVGSKLLFLAQNGAQPTGVEVSQRDHGMYFNSCEFISVEDIDFKHHEVSCIYFEACADVLVSGCSFRQSTQAIGNYPPSFARHTYQQCMFLELYNQAIISSAAFTTIHDNAFENIGLVPGLGNDGYGGCRGMLSAGDNAVIERNTFKNIGYSAMDVNGDNVSVRNNHIVGALKILNDGGGIAIDDCNGMVIVGNIVEDMSPNFPANSESSSFSYYAYEDISFGIYFGFFSVRTTTVEGNTVSGCGAGMHSDHTHFSQGNRIFRNTFFDNAVQLSISDASNANTEDPPTVNCDNCYVASYNDEYTGNVCYSVREDQRCLQLLNAHAGSWDGVEPLVDFGTFTDNHYFNPFSDFPVWIRKSYDFRERDVARTFGQWRAMGEDENSHVSPVHLEEPHTFTASGPELVSNTDFTGGVVGWETLDQLDQPCTIPVADNGAMKFTGCYITQNLGGFASFDAPADLGTYLFEFDAKADAPGVLEAFVYREIGGFNAMPTGDFVEVGTEFRHFSLRVDVLSACAACSDFRYAQFRDAENEAGVQANTFYVDNVSLKKADAGSYTPTADHLLFTYNPLDPNSTQTHTLGAGCWSDVYGNIYSGSVTIANEYESIVLFKLTDTYAIDTPTEHHIVVGPPVLWQTDMNVRGSVVVDPGATLIVDGATIGFADSRLDGNPVTNVVVQPGGTLKVINGGLLTSVPGGGCVPGMWDGVKNLGNGTGAGGGLVEVSSGGAITNAFTAILAADGDPELPVYGSPGGGGQIVLDYAVFENNQIDVFRAKHTSPVAQLITNSAFRTTRALNYPTEHPKAHYVMYQCGNTTFTGCTFGNYRSPLPADPLQRGIHGILGIETNLFIDRLGPQFARNRFENLFTGVGHGSLLPAFTLAVDECDFLGCSRSSWIIATDNVLFTENTVEVPETDEYDYGTYMYNCTGFEFEENVFTGVGSTTAKVGSVFSTCGPAYNLFYNNRYDGFTGNGPAGYSAGAIVSGNNRESGTGLGFTFKCNDFSNTALNDHDLAFTDAGVTVGSQQGAQLNGQSPAGNTFANGTDCMAEPDKHFYVQDGNVSTFEYWHHTEQPQIELVPDCASPPIVVSNLPGTWYHDAVVPYDPDDVTGSCPTMLSQFQNDDDSEDEITYAQNEAATLRDVYDDWSDGGDPSGLIDFINDPANTSYDVRNQLMLIAPKVSDEAWKTAFTRNPAMNPWHLAQALMANSPLTMEVIEMMTTYNLGAYYRQLVNGAQNGGVSMHSIYRSEIAYWSGRHARALRDLTARAIHSGDPQALANAFDWHGTHGTSTSPQSMLALSYALGDDARARQVVDAALVTGRLPEYWDVQDLYLTLRENDEGPEEVDANGIQLLENIATSGLYGAGHAQVWLSILGQSFPDHVVLPQRNRAQQGANDDDGLSPILLQASPNPTSGPIVVSVQLPEGSDGGTLRIIDPVGRMVQAVPFRGTVQVVEMDASTLANGLYAVAVDVDGIQLGVAKFEVAR